MLQRTRETTAQVTLSGRQRQENVADAFALDPGWSLAAGKRFVLIDDVRTTGATLGGCANALQEAKPASVGVLTFALDMHREQIEAIRTYVQSERVRDAASR